ncbi:unnamed protein product [Staurois parvus]|uniref:Uncharacterized protein n=1 Tax=Staurois parvus TaxID=386267 RepID=A0ABN9H795_9NEOB|nr:unnamed protein product [Staurois parvus]
MLLYSQQHRGHVQRSVFRCVQSRAPITVPHTPRERAQAMDAGGRVLKHPPASAALLFGRLSTWARW